MDIHEMENRKTVMKINIAKSWFFKIDKPLASLAKKNKKESHRYQNHESNRRHHHQPYGNKKD